MPRALTALALTALLTACGGPPDLSGDWSGDMTCGEGSPSIAFELIVDALAEEDSYGGDISVTLETTSGPIDIDWTLEMRPANASGDDPIDVDVDVEDCSTSMSGEVNCWSATATFDPGDEEMDGTYSGFPINDGSCDWAMEKLY